MQSQKKINTCSYCQNYVNNLVTMNCQHRLCIPCLKNYKLQFNNCIACLHTINIHKNQINTNSPHHENHHQQITTLKEKILNRVRSPSTSHPLGQQSADKTNRTQLLESNIKSNKKYSCELMNDGLTCRQHEQNLIMYCQQNKQLFCAQCIYLKNKKNLNLIPIKNALQALICENKLNRQQSRNSLNSIENSIKICSTNKHIFESSLHQYEQIIHKQFEDIYKQIKLKQSELVRNINKLLNQKIDEYDKILNDLEYLKCSIKEYRQHNKQNNNINNIVYVFSAYKIIKKTLKNINLNYISYNSTDFSLIQIDKKIISQSLKKFTKIKSDIPIKPYQIKASRINSLEKAKNTSHMQSIKQQNQSILGKQRKDKSNSIQTENSSNSKLKKHEQLSGKKSEFRLGNIIDGQQKNLYQRLLNEKFNKYLNVK